ncbi:hypothetical protein LBMAG42_56820 [Deltaproteobacteria bacterium]|nr:hypothetical protein LBMAG42_56820 [Deltaproteobacteria bacterium]
MLRQGRPGEQLTPRTGPAAQSVEDERGTRWPISLIPYRRRDGSTADGTWGSSMNHANEAMYMSGCFNTDTPITETNGREFLLK